MMILINGFGKYSSEYLEVVASIEVTHKRMKSMMNFIESCKLSEINNFLRGKFYD